MKELTIEMDVLLKKDLKDYLMSLNGVLDAKLLFEDEKIYIKYDEKIINDYMIKKELHLFFNVNFPSILNFNKHCHENIRKYSTMIEDVCCENCFLLFVNELYDIQGITKFQSDFDVCKKYRDVKIEIEYDAKLLAETDIIKIVNDY